MDILNGKFKLVGIVPVNGKAEIITRKLGNGLRKIDLLAIDETSAETLIANGCKNIQKAEPQAKKAGAEKVS